MNTASELSDYLSERVYDKFCETWGSFTLGGESFCLASLEEAVELGRADDPEILIRRESDGAFFEVDLEATARPVAVLTEAQRETRALEPAGQQVLPGVTG